jgi:hypothetical protein
MQKNMELLDPTENDLQIHPKPVMPRLRQDQHQHGQTIPLDQDIPGAKIFSDASWKNKKVPGFIGTDSTGIGIFIQFSREGLDFNIKIQASSGLTDSGIQAEAKAVLFGLLVEEKLQISGPTILTNNKSRALAVESRKLDSEHMHWNSRDTLAKILNSTSKLQAQVFHIRREANCVAHNCAHQVLRSTLGPPILGCYSSAHNPSSCHVMSSLVHSDWTGFVIHAVN